MLTDIPNAHGEVLHRDAERLGLLLTNDRCLLKVNAELLNFDHEPLNEYDELGNSSGNRLVSEHYVLPTIINETLIFFPKTSLMGQ